MRGTIRDVVHAKCSAARAFDLMADPRNELRWNSGVSAVELLTEEPIGEGTEFTIVDGSGHSDARVTHFDRPHRLGFALRGQKMDVDIAIVFTEAQGVTTISGTFEADTRGLMTVLFPFLKPLIRRQIAKEHVNFVRLCESAD